MLPTHRRSLLLALLAAPFAAAAQGRARTITWDDLMPKGWDPFKDLKGLDPGAVREGSANEAEMMREMRKIWDNAPTRLDLHGQALRLPGYVVPLEGGGGAGPVKEFLLVPYFGACIHSPPPPSNQIVGSDFRQHPFARRSDSRNPQGPHHRAHSCRATRRCRIGGGGLSEAEAARRTGRLRHRGAAHLQVGRRRPHRRHRSLRRSGKPCGKP